MSREEAASVYLKALPGFRGDYLRFREAAKMLTDSDRALLQHAVSVGRERLMHSRAGSFFCAQKLKLNINIVKEK